MTTTLDVVSQLQAYVRKDQQAVQDLQDEIQRLKVRIQELEESLEDKEVELDEKDNELTTTRETFEVLRKLSRAKEEANRQLKDELRRESARADRAETELRHVVEEVQRDEARLLLRSQQADDLLHQTREEADYRVEEANERARENAQIAEETLRENRRLRRRLKRVKGERDNLLEKNHQLSDALQVERGVSQHYKEQLEARPRD